MDQQLPPLDQDAFLVAPYATIGQVAPTTVIYAPGGTRRAAALADIPFDTSFAQWSQVCMFDCFGHFFRVGVQHLVVPTMRSRNFAEVGKFQEQIMDWIQWGLAGPEALQRYALEQWQVHLIITSTGGPHQLRALAATLEDATHMAPGPHLWYIMTMSDNEQWQWQWQVLGKQPQSRDEVVRCLYGLAIPPASLLVAFGKPIFSQDIIPPFLAGEVQCYWTQRPGYSLSERELRTILYDCAYLRSTWHADKTERVATIDHHRAEWERGPILGCGRQLGPYWFPLCGSSEV